MATAVKIEHLSKRYFIGHQRQDKYETVRDTLMHGLRGLGQRIRHPLSPNREVVNQEELWALRDINLEIEQGERVGIIGRNGAGKSTLLKVLSRITEPTEGRFTLTGRVASLLEVGTGFHPELTGRENIFLNGAILGMRKAEIKSKFDEIVAFAETEKFLDTPVKRYSSGMYVRLAFAVAAHLEPEILIVDEVLAVGDVSFQKKCLGKLESIGSEGRTIIFVSHNMAAILNLCSKVITMESGRIVHAGSPKSQVESYTKAVFNSTTLPDKLETRVDRTGTGKIILTGFRVEKEDGATAHSILSGDTFSLVFNYRKSVPESISNVDIGFSLHSRDDNKVLTILYSSYVNQLFTIDKQEGEICCEIRSFPFSPGIYIVGARLLIAGEESDWPRDGIAKIEVIAGDFYKTRRQNSEPSAPLLLNGNWKSRS